MTASPGRLLRTVRHLRGRQVLAQAKRRLPGRQARRGDPSEPAPAIRWQPDTFPTPAGGADVDRADVLAGRLSFVGRAETVGFPPCWEPEDVPRLWRYNLHYHEFLWRLPYQDARTVVLDWIERHPPGARRPGWEAYPTSLRLVNWCALFFGRHAERTCADPAFRQALWVSVRDQARHLMRNLEWHLLANHLLENAVALAVAGSCFSHREAARWLDRGCALLARELPEQILGDGGHIERSPMYQCRLLYVLRLLAATAEPRLVELATPFIERTALALGSMTHPDGQIALLNDSALGVYPGPEVAVGRTGAFALPQTGYYGSRNAVGDYIICDAGPIGPDYQPGHGHADLFSFELSLGGHRVVVDSGVATYDAGAMRDYCRGTRAHNTVEIEGTDQVELWAAFRVGRRTAPEAVRWQESADGFTLAGEHAGYRHLAGSPRHRRCFDWRQDGALIIEDEIVASRPVKSVARLHFHPACRIERAAENRCLVFFAAGAAEVSWEAWQDAGVTDSTYCPRFGTEIPNRCLALSSRVAMLRATIRLEKH